MRRQWATWLALVFAGIAWAYEIELDLLAPGPGEVLGLEVTLPPEGRYVPGSARFNGRPVEPRIENGRLLWRLPWVREGRLVYALTGGDRATVTPVRLWAWRPLERQVQGAWRVEAGYLYADGRSPLVVHLRGPAEVRWLTVDTNLEPAMPDADPRLPGYQLALEGGEAWLRLQPTPLPTVLQLRLQATDSKEGPGLGFTLPLRPLRQGLWLAEGSLSWSASGSLLSRSRGYGEGPWLGGWLQWAWAKAWMDGAVENELGRRSKRRFPLAGSGTASQRLLSSSDGWAFRYLRDELEVAYQDKAPTLPAGVTMGNGPTLSATIRGPQVESTVYLRRGTAAEKHVVLQGDGTRIYALPEPVAPGSVRVVLQEDGRQKALQPGRDFTVEEPGLLLLTSPTWGQLEVIYRPQEAPLSGWEVGGGLRWRRGPWRLEGAVAAPLRPAPLRFGLAAGYEDKHWSARLRYSGPSSAWQFTLASWQGTGPWSAEGSFSLDSTGASGRVALRRRLAEGRTLALEQDGGQSRLWYEAALSPAGTLGLGLGYAWDRGEGEALLSWRRETKSWLLELQPRWGLRTGPAVTGRAGYVVAPGVRLEATTAYAPTQGWRSRIGLRGDVAPVEWQVDYALPGADGAANRARFGLRLPLALDEHWGLDLYGGYELGWPEARSRYSLGSALRYRAPGWVASLTVENAGGGGAGSKTHVRAGLAGQLAPEHTVAFSLRHLVDKEGLRWEALGLDYAYRGAIWTILSTQRLTPDGFKGETALLWHPSLTLRTRTGAAYRPDILEAYAGVAIAPYPAFPLALGGVMRWLYPEQQASWSLELSYPLFRRLWIVGGYTFGSMAGVTPESHPGPYLRAELFLGGTWKEDTP